MHLGQILDILEKRYSSEVLRELPWDELSKMESDREEIIRTIWKSVIVPQVVRIRQDIKNSQKVGLYHHLDLDNRDDSPKSLADKIGVKEAWIKQFNPTRKELCRALDERYIGHLANGSLDINILHKIKDNSTELSEQLLKPYEKSLEELMSRLRKAVVDSETREKLKNIEGIASYLAEDSEKGTSTDSLETLTKSAERSSEREQDTRLGHFRESGNPVLLGSLKITDLHVMRMESEGTNNWMFVKIETDAGIHGWGEASLQYKDDALLGEFAAFKHFLLGKNPFEIERIWTSLYRRVTWSGGPVTTSAISAIDLALWDIKGKALGVPVYELLGGKSHDKIRMYANGWPRKDNTPEGIAEGVKRVVDQGYEALKFYPFRGAQVATIERIQHGVALVEAAREAAGSQIEIGIDIRARLNIWSARRVAQELEPYNIAWMEEPILWDNPAALAQFAREVNVPIATGEQLYTRWDFRALLELNAVGIIQPDICHAGGITELKKIAAMAETYYVTVAPHNSNGPISTVASLHLDLCIHNSLMQEIFVSSIERYNKVLTQPIKVIDGHCVPPEGPGWGVELREDIVEQHPPKSFTPIESEPYVEF